MTSFKNMVQHERFLLLAKLIGALVTLTLNQLIRELLMRRSSFSRLFSVALFIYSMAGASAQSPEVPSLVHGGSGSSAVVTGQNGRPASEELISPSRPIPKGKAPGMQIKLVSKRGREKVYAVIFRKGDEVLSGLTDFAIQNRVEDAHFTAIGAISHALVGWLDLSAKHYRAIHVEEQVEVLSMMGDIATFNGKPVVHAHMVLGRHDGTTVGGHLWEAYVDPTVEVFVTVNAAPLKKKPDDASGMKLIDPAFD
jgi:predicted DNA-binding protein with PD1-like motif